MADVFVSYKSEDRVFAASAAAALAQHGLSVFFDVDIPVGDQWDELIAAELDAARAVVVLWSPRSVESRWVKNEARSGLSRGILCPVVIEPCKIPLEFQDLQAAYIADFAVPSAALSKLTAKVLECCQKESLIAAASQTALPEHPQAVRRFDHYVSSLRRTIEICDFVSFMGCQQPTQDNLLEVHKAFSRLKFEIGQIESTERRVFKSSDLFVQTENAKYLIWEASKQTFAWPLFDSMRRAKLKTDIDEAAYNLSVLYADLRLDVAADDPTNEDTGPVEPSWFNGSKLSDEGVREIHRQFEAGKTIYAAAKHIGISYRAAALRHESWKRLNRNPDGA